MMQLCGKLFLLFVGFTTWFAVPLLIYSIREASDGCAGDDPRAAGVALRESPGFLDLINAATSGINDALHETHAGYYILAAASMVCVLATHLYVAHTTLVSRQSLRLHWHIFCVLFGFEVAIGMPLWLPPPSGYLQPGDRFLYLVLGIAPSCTEQLFSARLAWHLAICFDRFLHRSDRGHARIEALLCVLLPLFTVAVGHTMYGLGLMLTLLAAVVCGFRLRAEFEATQSSTRLSAKAAVNGALGVHPSSSSHDDDVVFSTDPDDDVDDEDLDALLSDEPNGGDNLPRHKHTNGKPRGIVQKYQAVMRIATEDLPAQEVALPPVAAADAQAAPAPPAPPQLASIPESPPATPPSAVAAA